MITWTVTELKVSQNPEPNTVTEITYKAEHVSGAARSGMVMLDPPSASFVDFTNLTEQQVLEWLWGHVNKDATESWLTERAGEMTFAPLPWDN